MRRALAIVGALAACGGGKGSAPAGKGSGATVDFVDKPTASAAADAAPSASAPGDEIESNDSEDVATPLPAGGAMRGKIGGADDADYFRIDVTKAGVLALDLTEIEGFDLALELEDASGTPLAKSDRGGVRVREGIPNYAVSAGHYIAVVRAKKPDPVKPPKLKKGQKAPPPVPPPPFVASPVYTLTASVSQPAAGGEREPDEDRGTANDLISGDGATGFIGWSGDVDTYKLSLETLSPKNALDIELAGVEGVALTLEVADAVGAPVMTRKGARHGGVVIRGFQPNVPPGGAPYHYLTVKGDRSNPETPYTLKVTEHAIGTDAELEPDDTIEKPMAIPADRTVVKATWSSGDIDCFAVAAGEGARTVDFTVTAVDGVDFALELYVDGKQIATANKGGKGAAEQIGGAVPAGGHAVLRVHANDVSAAGTEGGYTVTVSES